MTNDRMIDGKWVEMTDEEIAIHDRAVRATYDRQQQAADHNKNNIIKWLEREKVISSGKKEKYSERIFESLE